MLVGFVLLLFGIAVLLYIGIPAYKNLQDPSAKKSRNILFFLLGILDMVLGPTSLEGVAVLLSIIAIVLGLLRIAGVWH